MPYSFSGFPMHPLLYDSEILAYMRILVPKAAGFPAIARLLSENKRVPCSVAKQRAGYKRGVRFLLCSPLLLLRGPSAERKGIFLKVFGPISLRESKAEALDYGRRALTLVSSEKTCLESIVR
jgi:hypothetical protein